MNGTKEVLARVECAHNVIETVVTSYYGDEATEAECLALKQCLATVYLTEMLRDAIGELACLKAKLG